eukprot:scaffold54023_cov51-Phaeocystis_antarctica.AAC.1
MHDQVERLLDVEQLPQSRGQHGHAGNTQQCTRHTPRESGPRPRAGTRRTGSWRAVSTVARGGARWRAVARGGARWRAVARGGA